MVLYIAQSIDGYIATNDHNLEWLTQFDNQIANSNRPIKDSYLEFYKDVDVTIMGSTTYDYLLGLGITNPYADKENYVMTSKTSYEDNSVTGFVTFNEFVNLDFTNKKVWIVGGSTVFNQLLNYGLVTEMIIFQVPVILGDGIKLFNENKYSNWQLKSCISDLDFIQMHYTIKL